MKTIQKVLVLISTLICLTKMNAQSVDMEGINCPNFVSCAAIGRSNFTDRNCECDRQCVTYNDCCIDAPRRSTPQSTNSRNLTCVPFGDDSYTGAYVIETCSTNFIGPQELQLKCQDSNNVSDPIMSTPVTDTISKTSYRNRYCAECNNVAISNVQSWLINMVCNFASNVNANSSFIYQNIYYNRNLNLWRIDINGRPFTCSLKYNIPEYLLNKVRLCRSNVTSTCLSTWTRRRIKRQCESYTAIMYARDGSAVYRNPHCALCNELTVDEIDCRRGIVSRKRKPFSFTLLMDWNQNDGDVVGVSSQSCGANQKYDPYAKKCRNLVCALPGYERINGKCRKPS